LLSAEGLFQRDLHIVTLVTTALPTGSAIAEHFIEYVREPAKPASAAVAGGALFERSLAKPIIGGSFLIVFEGLISLGHLPELLLRGLIVGIAIGMEFQSETSVCLLDVIATGITGNSQQIVIIIISRHKAWLPLP
jgi:hypothetical protein